MTECITCGVSKPLDSFGARSDTGAIKNVCLECENKWHKAHYAANKEKVSAKRKAYYSKPETRERTKAYREARKLQDKIWKKNWDLQRHYGIDAIAFDATIEAQQNCCPICGVRLPRESRSWNVDHCHTTGNIRGIICVNCNHMLGKAKDRPEVLRAAADYLEKNK